MAPTFIVLPAAAFILLLLTLILRAVYRVTLHPLAKFPGPRLAAVTDFWAGSYDMGKAGSVVKHLKALHDQYGPIVRVRPNELHIFDWEAYRTVFKTGSDFNRSAELYNAPQAAGSFLNQPENGPGVRHRNLYVQAFSKAAINRLEPLIHEKAAIFLDRLHDAAVLDKVVELNKGFACLTADLTMHYCYQMSLDLLSAPDFQASLILLIHEMTPLMPIFWYFPAVGVLLNEYIIPQLPEAVVKQYVPAVAAMNDLRQRCARLIDSLKQAPPDSEAVTNSIFATALNPKQEKGQYVATPFELTGDAVLVFLAGTDTTTGALSRATWEMVQRPELWTRLQAEVQPVIPNTTSIVALKDIENLPFLRAVAKEAIRMSLGTAARLARVVPPQGTVLCGEHIAAGARVSFTNYVYNFDPVFFPDPHTFKPERWLADDVNELETHMISFSRGSRNCIGQNLAYAELYTTLAHLVRRFDIENAGTTPWDMDWTDSYVPRYKGNLKIKLRTVEK